MTSAVRPADEAANAITHGVGWLLSLPAGGYLLLQAEQESTGVRVAIGIYVVSLWLLYGCSTLSHLFYDIARRRRFRMFDQSCIFLLIAGTYTPFAALYLHSGAWWGLLIGMWSLSALGIWRVVCVGDLSGQEKFLYGVLGCLPSIALGELSRRAPDGVMFWVLLGGASYLLGTPFLSWSRHFRYAHAIWHVCVIAGSACHYQALLLAVRDRLAVGSVG